MSKLIRKEAFFAAPPQRVFDVLTNGQLFTAATGRPASIEPVAGTSASLFGGLVQARHLELIAGEKIVQSWRFAEWDSDLHSKVEISLSKEGSGTRLSLSHSGYPEGPSPLYPSWEEHLGTNWPVYYFEPIARYLSN